MGLEVEIHDRSEFFALLPAFPKVAISGGFTGYLGLHPFRHRHVSYDHFFRDPALLRGGWLTRRVIGGRRWWKLHLMN